MKPLDIGVLVLTVLGGAVCAVGATLYLNLYIGAVPFPVSAVVFGGLLAWISVAARRLGGQTWCAALPVIGFTLMVIVFLSGGPGSSVMYYDWRLLFLLVCGIGMPALAGYLASSDR